MQYQRLGHQHVRETDQTTVQCHIGMALAQHSELSTIFNYSLMLQIGLICAVFIFKNCGSSTVKARSGGTGFMMTSQRCIFL